MLSQIEPCCACLDLRVRTFQDEVSSPFLIEVGYDSIERPILNRKGEVRATFRKSVFGTVFFVPSVVINTCWKYAYRSPASS